MAEAVRVLVADDQALLRGSFRLVIGLPTVKTHVSSLLAKLNARDRAQLVIVAYESGLTKPGVST